jgi:phosphoglycolate phosphatase-like HAD superfamily hydrolase
MKTVIFDLDGTLALIDDRRAVSTKDNGKMDWDKFFDPNNIQLDKPNWPVILMAQTLKKAGHRIVIFSGRSKATKDATRDWLNNLDIPFDVLKMRPTDGGLKWMKDDLLKKKWLDDLFPNTDDIICVFDDRDKVVQMWRDNGITCFQVANGNF